MDDKQTKRGGGAVVVMALVVLLVVLPILHVPSVGPVARLADNRLIDQKWQTVLGRIYWPLDWTAENVPVVRPAIIGYVEWWQPPQPIYSAPTLPVSHHASASIGGPKVVAISSVRRRQRICYLASTMAILPLLLVIVKPSRSTARWSSI